MEIIPVVCSRINVDYLCQVWQWFFVVVLLLIIISTLLPEKVFVFGRLCFGWTLPSCRSMSSEFPQPPSSKFARLFLSFFVFFCFVSFWNYFYKLCVIELWRCSASVTRCTWFFLFINLFFAFSQDPLIVIDWFESMWRFVRERERERENERMRKEDLNFARRIEWDTVE